MRGEDLVGNMRLMGLGDPPYPEDQFVAKVSTPPVRVVRRTPAASTAQYITSQQQIAQQQLAAARLSLQQRAQQQAQQQAAQQRYQQQAQQIAAANMAAKTILDAAKSTAASYRAEAVPVAVSAGVVQSATSAQAAAQGASQNSTNISVSIQSRAPEPQVEDWSRYIIAPRPERDLADIKREMDLSLAISRQAEIDRAYAAQQQQKAYEPTYIESPWVARVFGGQSVSSGVSTQLPDVAGEIVELPDLPQTAPFASFFGGRPGAAPSVSSSGWWGSLPAEIQAQQQLWQVAAPQVMRPVISQEVSEYDKSQLEMKKMMQESHEELMRKDPLYATKQRAKSQTWQEQLASAIGGSSYAAPYIEGFIKGEIDNIAFSGVALGEEGKKKLAAEAAAEIQKMLNESRPMSEIEPALRAKLTNRASQIAKERASGAFAPVAQLWEGVKQGALEVVSELGGGGVGVLVRSKLSDAESRAPFLKFNDEEIRGIEKNAADAIRSGGNLEESVTYDTMKLVASKTFGALPSAYGGSAVDVESSNAANEAVTAMRVGGDPQEAFKGYMRRSISQKAGDGLLSEGDLARVGSSFIPTMNSGIQSRTSDIYGLSRLKLKQMVGDDLAREVSEAQTNEGWVKWYDPEKKKDMPKHIKNLGDPAVMQRYMRDRQDQLTAKYEKKLANQDAEAKRIRQSSPGAVVMSDAVGVAIKRLAPNWDDMTKDEARSRLGDKPMSEEQVAIIKSIKSKEEANRIFSEYAKKSGSRLTSSSGYRAGKVWLKEAAGAINPDPSARAGRVLGKAEVISSAIQDLAPEVKSAILKDLFANGGTIWRELGPLSDSVKDEDEQFKLIKSNLVPLMNAGIEQVGMKTIPLFFARMDEGQRKKYVNEFVAALLNATGKPTSPVYAGESAIEGGRPGSTMRGLRGFEWVS